MKQRARSARPQPLQTKRGERTQMIFEYLGRGRAAAKTGKELCSLLDLSPRELTAAIERERREGHPICAATDTPYGYYLAADMEEMEMYCKSLAHRIAELCKTKAACKKAGKSLPVKEE